MAERSIFNDADSMFGRNSMPYEISSKSTSNSLMPSDAFSNMAGFPVTPTLQGQPISDLQGQFHVNHNLSISPLGRSFVGNSLQRSSVQEFPGDIPIPPALATLLTTRQENLPLNFIEASSSSYATCEYEDIAGPSKWDSYKSNGPTPAELGMRACNFPGNFDPNGWWVSSAGMTTKPCNAYVSPNPSGELSLSLATSQPSVISSANIWDQQSEISNNEMADRTSCDSRDISLQFRPYRPMQFWELISGSKYLSAIQEILAEVACYALENLDPVSYLSGGSGTGISNSYSSSCQDVFMESFRGVRDIEARKTQLLNLLQAVDDRYNQCLDEIHTVISAFHAATELDPKIHTRFALQTMSILYKNLREGISSHILSMGERECLDHRGGSSSERERSLEVSLVQRQWAIQQLKRKDHQLWRPQRGLPEKSVSVLRAWMFQNFLHPYPKDAEKHLLALKSGLTRSQVANWFINARVRLWKPMIEEMYAELNRRKAHLGDEEEHTEIFSRNCRSITSRRLAIN